MNQITLSAAGINPSITYDAVNDRVCVIWQNGSTAFAVQVNPVTLAVSRLFEIDLKGGQASYPEICYWDTVLHCAWRDGGQPFEGHFDNQLVGQVHGSRPFAMGDGSVAYIAGGAIAGYPTRMTALSSPHVALAPVVRSAAGTGLSRVFGLSVRTVDEDRGAVPGISDPSWSADAVVGTTDKDGEPTLLAFRGDKQCFIAPGQVSKDPRMCTDGRWFFVTAWGDQGEGVRLWRVASEDFVEPTLDYTRTPDDIPDFRSAKYAGYYLAKSRYGDFNPIQNSTILARKDYANSEGICPPDTDARMIAAAQEVSRIFIDGTKADLELMRPYWDKVAVVFHHEVGDPAATRSQTQVLKNLVKSLGLTARPIMSTLTPLNSVQPGFNGTADIAACEIYFDQPAASYDEMELKTQQMIDTVLRCQTGKVILIAQSYDRPPYDRLPGSAWHGRGDMLEAINFVCARALAQEDRIVGILWFSYARQGGTLDYDELVPWHEQVVVGAPVPARLPIPIPPKPPVGDDMNAEDIRRYIAELPNPVLFGAYERFHNEVLPRDRPLDGAIKSAAWASGDPDFWTGDVTTGGANGIFNRVYIAEYCIARDKGRTAEEASGDAYDVAKKSYDEAVKTPQ